MSVSVCTSIWCLTCAVWYTMLPYALLWPQELALNGSATSLNTTSKGDNYKCKEPYVWLMGAPVAVKSRSMSRDHGGIVPWLRKASFSSGPGSASALDICRTRQSAVDITDTRRQ
ncbi:hypothetical protein RRG08_032993 [Elysia crispata]|uniref:Uncharacterized protein n=1 Tax=Elysia crispata TaxID=231223 RepID=A0AAE0YS77_9GAST|nr:hypothetical protein RRG08_032993 [Elysia crispata]